MLTVKRRAAADKSLTDVILESLEAEIIHGALRPRERLVETELSARFGVSRAPIREALRMLQREGLVSKGSRGLQVADISREAAGEIFEVLANLEDLYTARAAPHVTPRDLQKMSNYLSQMQRSVSANDIKRYFELNDAFHMVIRDACPNRTLIQLLSSLGKKTLRFRRLAMSLPGRIPKSIEEHRRIFEAIERGDAKAAGIYARESTERAFRALSEFLEHSAQFV